MLTLLTGCVTTQAPAPVNHASIATPIRATSPAEQALTELGRLQALSPQEAAIAREMAREDVEREPSSARRTQYLLTLLVAPPSPADDDRALLLVDGISNATNTNTNGNEEVMRTLAGLARDSAMTRKKLREEAALQRGRVVSPKRDDREPEMRLLKQRVEELEKQLAAIKSIERSVSRR